MFAVRQLSSLTRSIARNRSAWTSDSIRTRGNFFNAKPATQRHVIASQQPVKQVRAASSTFFRSFTPFTLRQKSLVTVAAVTAAIGASYYYAVTNQSILEQVVIDKRGDLYLAAAEEELFYDEDSKRVLSYYNYLKSFLKKDDLHPSKISYLILFPVIDNGEGQLTIDYDNPACASQISSYKFLKLNHLSNMATREDLEGRGLGKVMLVNAAERAIQKGRSFAGDPIPSAKTFYIHTLSELQKIVGTSEGTGRLFELESYEQRNEAEYDVVIPLIPLTVLVNLFKIREELKGKPVARREDLEKHPELRELYEALQEKLSDREWVLQIQQRVDETLFSRIYDRRQETASVSVEESASPAP